MGDVLLATPIGGAFKEVFPDVLIDVLAEPIPAQTLRHNPDIERVIKSPKRGSGPAEYIPLIRELRVRRYRAAIDALSTPGSALLTRLTGSPIRIGYDLPRRRRLYTHPIAAAKEAVYAPMAKRRLLSAFGLEAESTANASSILPKVYPGRPEEAEAKKVIERAGGDGRLILGLAPFCRREWKQWKIPYWRETLERLNDLNAVWLLFAAGAERPALEELESAKNMSIQWVGAEDLLVAAAAMRMTKALIGGDNGLLHVAVAAGVPTFTVFAGRDDPKRWVPPSSPDHIYIDFRERRDDPKTPNECESAVRRLLGQD